jgi:predicted nuclease of predicted toxin-antitoxin system
VRFLLDENQSPTMVELLARLGHDAVHVRDVGLARSSDGVILAAARNDSRVVVSGDTDFGDLLASTNAASPSVVLIRRQGQRRAVQVVALLHANLEAVLADLDAGAVVVIDADRVRIRRLPLRPI